MHERLRFEFLRGDDKTYIITQCSLEPASYETNRQKQVTHFAQNHPDKSKCLAVVVLAFVRMAQYRFVGLVENARREAPIFRFGPAHSVFSKFKDIYNDTKKRPDSSDANYPRVWLRHMLSLNADAPNYIACGRLERWFSVSQKKEKRGVFGDVAALSPESIHLVVNGKEAAEAEIDRIESFLSLQVNAGFPCYLDEDGFGVAGKNISVSPEWFGQEKECVRADDIFQNETAKVLAVLGSAWAGKTVFAVRWMRRLISQPSFRKKYRMVFRWSFNRGWSNTAEPVPQWEFFAELAKALDIELPSATTSLEQASLILAALRKQPVFFLLDGFEAAFSACSDEQRSEQNQGLVSLLRAIAAGNGSFSLVTSQKDFADAMGLKAGELQKLHLRNSFPDIGFGHESALCGSVDPAAMRAGKLAQLCGMLAKSAMTVQDSRSKNSNGSLDGEMAVDRSEVSDTAKSLISQILGELDDCPKVLLFIISAAKDAIAEDDLLSVARRLTGANLWLDGDKVSDDEWQAALTYLCEEPRLLSACTRQAEYIIYRPLAAYIVESLKRNSFAFWVAINEALGRLLLERSPNEVTERDQIAPLMKAVVYFCQAGNKHVAYHIIGKERLCRGLKGHIMNVFCDYETPRIVNAAILSRDADFPDVNIPREATILCPHVNAICSRFSDQPARALGEARAAWKLAQSVGTASAILPPGVNLVRLCQMFGALGEAKEVEDKIAEKIKQEIGRKVRNMVFLKRDHLEAGDMVDGISVILSTVALSKLYRGESRLMVNGLLAIGLKACRDHRHRSILLPTYGRPWHALALLEMGNWRECEKAIEAKEWFSDILRYQKKMCFETLAAKMYLLKATDKKSSQDERCDALARGRAFAEEVMGGAKGSCSWWRIFAKLIQGELCMEQGAEGEAKRCLGEAVKDSEHWGFELLEVDARIAQAQLLKLGGSQAASRREAHAASDLANRIGYVLRKPALLQLLKA